MSRLRSDESGVSLIEVIVAMIMSMAVFTATLVLFNGIQNDHKRSMEAADAQEMARRSIDRLMRDLRNLASPTDFATPAGTRPQSVEKNGKYDLIFKAVDDAGGVSASNPGAVKRVRYCLSNAAVYQQTQPAASFTAAAPAAAACPSSDAGWSQTRIVAQNVVNTLGGKDRPVFAYSADSRMLAYDNPADLPHTTRVETDLFVDTTPDRDAAEVRLRSSVLLRNQNRAPIAAFEASVSGRTVRLNASASEDPEAEPLVYEWFEGATKIGTGLILQVTYTGPGTHSYTLKVHDPAGLEASAVSASPVVVS